MTDFAPRSASSHHAQDEPVLVRDTHVLDNPAWSALTGAHAEFAEGNDLVKRYASDVSAFGGVATWDDPAVWDALIDVYGHGAEVFASHAEPDLPEGWEYLRRGYGLQLAPTDRLLTRPFAEAIELGADDVDDMLALVERNKPGPFLPRTHELGRYVGVRRGGRLVAMAGERLHADGWTEISAVSVDESARRQGLASALTSDVAHAIRSRGDEAFMHASSTNTAAVSAYEKMGFEIRRRVPFLRLRTP